MIDLEVALELMTDFAEEVYETLEGKYPRFIVEEWKDKVFLSRQFKLGTVTATETEILTQWAFIEGVSIDEFTQNCIDSSIEFMQMRQSLATLYKGSLQAAHTATPDQLPTVIQGIIVNAQVAMVAFARGDDEIENALMDSLANLTQGFTDGA